MNILWTTFKNKNPIMCPGERKDIENDFTLISKLFLDHATEKQSH